MVCRNLKLIFLGLVIFIFSGFVVAQNPAAENQKIAETIEKDGCTNTDEGKIKICKFDYKFKGKTVEAISFRPVSDAKYAGVMLIPGYQGTPQRYIGLGRLFARAGFAAMSVGTPGFGKTDLVPDFIGENTIESYVAGFNKFKKESFVDADKTAIFGYSRGAMAASLMLPKLKKKVKAAVLGGGVYELKKFYEASTVKGIRENVEKETGATDEAFKKRSSVYKVKKFQTPVLIVHGGKDVNSPTEQAYLLRDELKKHKKDFEIKIYEDRDHSIFSEDFFELVIGFISRKLKTEINNK